MSRAGYLLNIVGRVRRLLLDGRYILLCMFIWYCVAGAVGYATATGAVALVRQNNMKGLEVLLHPEIKYTLAEIKDIRLFRSSLGLFVHNAIGVGLVLYLGSLLIFIAPLCTFAEAWTLGALLEQGGYQSLLRRTTPHGLIEIPLVAAASSVAILLAIRFYRGLGANFKKSLLSTLQEASLAYIVCLPLLAICAALEGYGTRILWG